MQKSRELMRAIYLIRNVRKSGCRKLQKKPVRKQKLIPKNKD